MKRIKNRRGCNYIINYKAVEAIVLFASVCEFPIFERFNPYFGYALSVLRLVVVAYCFAQLITKRRFQIDRFYLRSIIFLLLSLLSTLVNTPTLIVAYIKSYLYPFIYTSFVFEQIFSDDELYNVRISAIAGYLRFFVWTNFICMLVWKNGIIQSADASMHVRPNWIFGSKNNIVPFLPIVLCILGMDLFINKKERTKKYLNFCSLIIAAVSFCSMGESRFDFLNGSTTALVEIVLAGILLLLFSVVDSKQFSNLFSMRNICFITIALMFCIIRISQSTGGPIYNLIRLLGKDVTFTGRYSVWAVAVDAIQESPLLGIGMEERIFRTWDNWASLNTTIYSYWLSIGVRFGIPGLLANIFMFSSSENKKNGQNSVNNICRISFFVMMVGGLTSTINVKYWALLLMLTYTWNYYGYKQNCRHRLKWEGRPLFRGN